MRIKIKPGGVLVALILLGILTLAALRITKTATDSAVAQPQPTGAHTPPTDGTTLIEAGDFAGGLGAPWIPAGLPPTVKPASDGLRHFLPLIITPPTKDPVEWSVRLGQIVTDPLKKGDRLTFRGWMRSRQSLTVAVYVEEAQKPHGKMLGSKIILTPQWQEYTVDGVVNRNYTAKETQLMIHFGKIPGTVDLADFSLCNGGDGTSPVPPSP